VLLILLNNFRKLLQPVLYQLGKIFSSTGIPPNVWTFTSFILAVLAGFVYATYAFHPLFFGSLIVLLSGFFDIVDGQVARFSKSVSHKGEFLDSILDRVGEFAIYLGIFLGNYTDGYLVFIAMSLSFLISYIRSKSESMKIKIQGIGIGERAERLFIIVILGMAGLIEIAIVVIIIISVITVLQRLYNVLKNIKTAKK